MMPYRMLEAYRREENLLIIMVAEIIYFEKYANSMVFFFTEHCLSNHYVLYAFHSEIVSLYSVR